MKISQRVRQIRVSPAANEQGVSTSWLKIADRAISGERLDLSLLSHFQGAIDLDAQVPDRALQVRVTQQ